MYRPFRRSWVLPLIVSLALLTAHFATAAPNDAAAQKLCDQAIDQDCAAKDFAQAEKKLDLALAMCDRTADCAPFMRARIHSILGAVELAMHRLDLARTEFATALLEDPDAALDPRVADADTQREFSAIKSAGPTTIASSAQAPTEHTESVATGQGGISHTPTPSQAVGGPAAASSAIVAESADCPPGLPGCHADEPKSCASRDDCMAGEECVDRACKPMSEDEPRAYKRNWLSLGVQADLLLMPGADDACAGNTHYTCFRSDGGSYYADMPAAGRDDKVLAGFAPLPVVRILVGYDRAVLPNLTIGGRLGYAVFGGGPQRPANGTTPAGPAFMPVHVEGRLAYWFGKNVLARQGLRFYLLLAGGMTEIDASNPIDIYANATSRTQTAIDAWTKTGLGFGAFGPGLMYAVTPNGGFLFEAKAIGLFPTTGIAIAAQLGYTIGL